MKILFRMGGGVPPFGSATALYGDTVTPDLGPQRNPEFYLIT